MIWESHNGDCSRNERAMSHIFTQHPDGNFTIFPNLAGQTETYMKKILILFGLTTLCLVASAQTKMFWGLKGGVFYDSGNSVTDNVIEEDPSTLSFTIKPSFGWYLNPNLTVGFKGEFADSKVYVEEGEEASFFSQSMSLRNFISNLTLGNGLGSNFISWKLLPYARYRVGSMFSPKINLWVELELYAGQKFERDTENGGFETPNTIYGVVLSPMVSYDLNESLMLCFTPDMIRWDGQHKHTYSADHTNTHSISAQFNPLYQVLSGLFNISIIKKF